MSLYSNMMYDEWQDEDFIDEPDFWEDYELRNWLECEICLDDLAFYIANQY